MRDYGTMVEALNDLKQRGFTLDFNLTRDALHNSTQNITLQPDDFEIAELYRFEGESDPADSAIVYGINSDKYNIKGVFVNAYGVYSDDISEDLLKKLNTPG
ncbi:MAG: phosphoribosylpyrophosphate synthetase [Sphingobacteriaceae bacterium]|jgi:hypothetical protein|nr:phosphoribosylpyrophosphate synthetase [Sphingobacteriaceae bacterium]